MKVTHLPLPDRGARHTVLVADDDPSTRQFLAGALASLGYEVTLAVDGADALRHAAATRFDALLLDYRMPNGGAMEVLRALRADPDAASTGAPAFATSAEITPSLRSDLDAAGFTGAIEKPCRIASLLHALEAVLGVAAGVVVLDDDDGLVATGDETTMAALRQLLTAELMELRDSLQALAQDPSALIERMHRLRSACGFCGAARLGAQAKALQAHVHEARRVAPVVVARFLHEVNATISALAGH